MQDHKQISEYLRSIVRKKGFFHAYVFQGWSGVGKKQTARLYCKSILCHNNSNGKSCGTCSSCQSFEKNVHFDFLPLIAEQGKKIISFEQLQEWRERLYYRSASGKYRIGYIESMQAMQTSSMQGLLKILEEPPENTIIILVLNQGIDIPSTVYSRCHSIQFPLIFSKSLDNNFYSAIGRPYFEPGISPDALNKQRALMRSMLSDEIGLKQYFRNVKSILDHIRRCSDFDIDSILHSWIFDIREQVMHICESQSSGPNKKMNFLLPFLQSLLSLQQSIKHNNSINKALAIENILFSVIH